MWPQGWFWKRMFWNVFVPANKSCGHFIALLKSQRTGNVSWRGPSFLAWGNKRFYEFPCQRTGNVLALVCRIFLAVGRSLLPVRGDGARAEILQNLLTAEFLRGPLLHAGKLKTEFPRSKSFFRKTVAFQNDQTKKFNVNKACGIQTSHLAKWSSMAFKVMDRTAGNLQGYSPLLSLNTLKALWTKCTFVRSQRCVYQLLWVWEVALSQCCQQRSA